MAQYEVWCRPHGRRDLAPSMAFLLEAGDHRSAWQTGMHCCFAGGAANLLDGTIQQLAPRRWTVAKVKPHAEPVAPAPESDPDDGWPCPDPEFVSSGTRENAISRLYAGRSYEDLPIRRSKTVLSFAVNRRPVMLYNI